MNNINRNARELDDLRLRQIVRPRGFIDISPDGGHGRSLRKLIENLRRTYVTRMNDVFRLTQRCDRFGTKQAVRVGNDADEDGSPQFSGSDFRFEFIIAFISA